VVAVAAASGLLLLALPRNDQIPRAAYSSTGAFLDWGTAAGQPVPQDARYDGTGLPMVNIGSPPRWSYDPVTICQYGLREYSAFIEGHDRSRLRNAGHAADWLVQNQSVDGIWYYNFDFDVGGMDVTLPAPWASAMGQGQAISLLTRVAHATGMRAYLTTALNGLKPLEREVRDGGLTDDLFGHPMYEEYPTTPPSHVLNGFIFTLLGLYDLSVAVPDSDATRLYAQGVETLDFALPLYDTGAISAYHLGHLTRPPRPVYTSLYYHRLHVQLLHAINSITPRRNFVYYERVWAASVGAAPYG
jgi:heparosan-N-sulfate-glucuronate 5-epimerase